MPSAGRNRALARTAVCAVLGRMVHRHRIDLDQCPVEPSSCSLGAGRVEGAADKLSGLLTTSEITGFRIADEL